MESSSGKSFKGCSRSIAAKVPFEVTWLSNDQATMAQTSSIILDRLPTRWPYNTHLILQPPPPQQQQQQVVRHPFQQQLYVQQRVLQLCRRHRLRLLDEERLQ